MTSGIQALSYYPQVSKVLIVPLHTRVEPVGRVAKMNWLNYDMGMKIHAICDAKNAILKYFSLDMWKFSQIWAFFFLYREFQQNKKSKKMFFFNNSPKKP